MSQVMPPEGLDLCVLERSLPPLLVISYPEHDIVRCGVWPVNSAVFTFERQFLELPKGRHNIVNHGNRPAGTVLCVPQGDDPTVKVDVRPSKTVLFTLPHSGPQCHIQLVDAVLQAFTTLFILRAASIYSLLQNGAKALFFVGLQVTDDRPRLSNQSAIS